MSRKEWELSHSFLLGPLRLPRQFDAANFSFFGSVGSGKTTLILLLMKSQLGWIPPETEVFNSFVFDIKNQFYRELLRWRIPLKVILTNVLDRRAWAWEMWRDIKDPVAAEQFAYEALPDDKSSSDNKFFTEAPRHIFAGVLREFVRRGLPWSLRHAYLMTMDEFYARQLFESSPDPIVQHKLILLDDRQGNTKANISTSLLTKLGNLATYAALMEHAKRRYSIAEMIRSDVVMVFGGDFRFNHVLAPMNNLIFRTLKNELISQPGMKHAAGRRHYLFCDEFPKLNYNRPSEDFADFCELGRSFGVRVLIACQSPQQLKELYGEFKTDTLIGQCQNMVVLRVSDAAGAQYLSQYLGQVYGYEWTRSVSVGGSAQGGPNWGESAQEQFVDRPLVPRHLIQQLPLASWSRPFRAYAAIPGLERTRGCELVITPEFLRRHLCDFKDVLDTEHAEDMRPYSDCRRTAAEQYLLPLNPYEVRDLGLIFNPNGYRP